MTPKEPAADIRLLANVLRQMYEAFVAEGFTPHEALIIIGQALAAQGKAQS